MKVRFLELLLVVVSLAVGYGLIEIGYRAYLYYTLAIDAKYGVMTVDAPSIGFSGVPGTVIGPYKVNSTVHRKVYDADDNVVLENHYRVNNLGWISGSDYTREKPDGEYRIAVIGDSLTGNMTSNLPWTDVLQRRLNADPDLVKALGVQRIAVLNLGVAGASMEFMANPLAVIARRFSPDMLVVNYITEDLPRRHNGALDTLDKMPPEPPAPVNEVQSETPYITVPSVTIRGVAIPLTCASGPPTLSNPDCRPSTFWSVPRGKDVTAAEVRALKQAVAREALWQRIVLSTKPLALLEAIGRANAQSAPTAHSQDSGADIELGLRALGFISRLHSKVIVTHNPLQWHLDRTNRPAAMEPFIEQARAAGHDVVQMEDHLPVSLGAAEWARWYMLPYDGHWSDYGGEVYGKAMYELLRARLMKERDTPTVQAVP